MSKAEPVSELDSLKADLAALRDDFGAISKSLIDQGSQGVKAAAKAVTSKVNDVSGTVEEFVDERPFTSILLAFGAGMLVAALLKRS